MSDAEHDDFSFPVVDLATAFLTEDQSGAGQYAWGENGSEALAALLDAIFALPCDPLPRIDDLLRLACALETELKSPSAAAQLLVVLRSDPRVIALLEGPSWIRSTEIKRAPMYGAEPPPGSIPLRLLAESADSFRASPRSRTARCGSR